MADPLLVARDVSRRYGRVEALRGVDFAVNAGELFGLLGPNGAGKTTLMGLLAGLADADGGSVELGGRRLSTRARDLRAQVGLATQDLALYLELTARENLIFFGRLFSIPTQTLKLRAAKLLDSVELSAKSDARVGTFSGGMKRRLNLAVAVLHEPILLLLDEPTTGVDPQSRNHIFELIRALNTQGTTVIYTSHYMEEVERLCPRLAVLDHGRVIACDGLAALLGRLPCVITLAIDRRAPEFAGELRLVPGVSAVEERPGALAVTAADAAAILPRLARAADAAGVAIGRLDVRRPNLEELFLSLTGPALRD